MISNNSITKTLPQGWKKCKFSDIATIRNGYAFSKNDFSREQNHDNGIPLIKQTQLDGNKVDLSKACYLPTNYLKEYSDFLIQKNDVLIGMSGSIGKLCIYQHDFPALQNQRTGLIKTYNNEIDNKFFWLFLQTIETKLMSGSKGVGVQNISSNDIEDIEFSLPPLSEQQRIVAKIDSLFSELENGVTMLKTIKAQLAIYRQAVFKWAFEGKLTEEWRHINTNENQENTIRDMTIARDMEVGKEKYKNIDQEFPIYELPKEWKWVSIGYISKGVSYGTSSKSSKKGKVVVLRMGNIQNGTFVYDDLAYTSNKKEIEKYQLHEGDVLFNRTNSPELVGKTALYNGSIPSIFAGYLIRLNQISYINASYLTYYLNSPHARECGNIAKTDGVNQSNINGTKLSTYPFPLCSKSEQQAIVSAIESRLSVCDKLEQTIDQTLALSASLRQSILKKAFEGRLVPQDPNDEPAEKLLERIKAEKAAVLEKQKKTRKRGKIWSIN